MPEFDGLQACVKTPPPLLIEQTVEEQKGGLELLGQHLKSRDISHNGNGLRRSPR